MLKLARCAATRRALSRRSVAAAGNASSLAPTDEAKALELCQQIGAEPYVKAARATVYQWATSPATVVAELRDEDFSAWPESLAAIGYAVRGAAYFQPEARPGSGPRLPAGLPIRQVL